jgi:hypothetical protein
MSLSNEISTPFPSVKEDRDPVGTILEGIDILSNESATGIKSGSFTRTFLAESLVMVKNCALHG